jgi:transcriptional regulator with XRE-family HTH domain
MVGPSEYPRELAECFGRNLVRARRRADLSQEQLSAISELHRTAIGLLERGARLPRLDTIVKLAGGIEVDAADLIVGMRWFPGPPKQVGFYVAEERLQPSGEGG